jgi:hypothetical protein
LLLGEWVESVHNGLVGKWVLLSLVVDSDGSSNFSKLGLNLIGVNDSSNISASHNMSVEVVSLLLERIGLVGTEYAVEGLEGILGVDDKSTEMTTWSKLEDVKSIDVAGINTWEISCESLEILGFTSVNEEWSLSHNVSRVSIFANTLSNVLGFSDLLEIFTGSESLKGGKKGFGVWKSKVVENKWEFWNAVDSVTSGHDEWGTSRSSEGRSDSMSSLGDVSLSVPFSPDLEWSEHTCLSAHITESGLTRSVGTRS